MQIALYMLFILVCLIILVFTYVVVFDWYNKFKNERKIIEIYNINEILK